MTEVAEPQTTTESNPGNSAAAHMLCEDWAYWCYTRKFLGAPKPLKMDSIAKWAAPMRATAWESPDGPMDADMQVFNIVVMAQPMSKARQAFILYYLNRVRPVKSIARALGVSRQHVHVLIDQFRDQVLRAYRRMDHAA